MVTPTPNITTADAMATIRENVASFLVKPLMKQSAILNSGVSVFRSSAPFKVPTIGQIDPSPKFYSELEEIAPSEAKFGELSLLPTERTSLKTLSIVSNELIREANVVGVESALQNRIVTDVRDALDTALLTGDGANNSITGLLNQAGVQAGTFDPANADSILDGIALVEATEAQPNLILMNGADFLAIRKLKDGNARYLVDAGIHDQAQHKLFGLNVKVTNKIPTGTVVVAAAKDIAVVIDADPRVSLDASRYFDIDGVGIRCVARADLGLLRPESVAILKAAA